METQLQPVPVPFKDCSVLRQNESLSGVEVVDSHLVWQIEDIAKQRTWSAVHCLYRWVCSRVADSLQDRLPQIKVSVNEHSRYNYPPYDKLSHQDLQNIQSCDSVDGIMQIVGILEQWIDVSYLEKFLHNMANPLAPSFQMARLWLFRYKQLLQYLCCSVLLTEAPDELLQGLLQGAKTSLQSSKVLQSSQVLVVLHELDYKQFSVAQLLKEKECLESFLHIPAGQLSCLRVEDGHSVAIYWLIDKRHIAQVMLDGRWIFWPLLEHQVKSVEIVGVLLLSLKGRHVPYLIRDALLSRQDLIQQTEVKQCAYMPHA